MEREGGREEKEREIERKKGGREKKLDILCDFYDQWPLRNRSKHILPSSSKISISHVVHERKLGHVHA